MTTSHPSGPFTGQTTSAPDLSGGSVETRNYRIAPVNPQQSYYSPRFLEILEKNLYMSDSTWHKVMHPFCPQCMADIGEHRCADFRCECGKFWTYEDWVWGPLAKKPGQDE